MAAPLVNADLAPTPPLVGPTVPTADGFRLTVTGDAVMEGASSATPDLLRVTPNVVVEDDFGTRLVLAGPAVPLDGEPHDVVVDPLVMPIGALGDAGLPRDIARQDFQVAIVVAGDQAGDAGGRLRRPPVIAGQRGAQTHLAVDGRRRQAFPAFLEDEAADLAVPAFCPDDEDVGDRAVGDPHLLAGEHVVAASGDDLPGNPPAGAVKLIERRFQATDGNDGVAPGTCTQRIWVVDYDPFFITDQTCNNPNPQDGVIWPCDVLLTTCPDDLGDTGEPTVFDDACSLIGVTYDDTRFDFVDSVCFKILREWSVIDWCQYNPQTGEGEVEFWLPLE